MLKLLSITNFAVVSEATIEFGEGLNLLTGETGSGKSIFVDALGLLLGARASAEIVRGGESSAFIQGIFAVDENPHVQSLAEQAGIDLGDGELIIRREISDRSRSRTYVNDRLATVALLRELRPYLLDIHGQGDQQTLLYQESHVALLDEFAGLVDLRAQAERAYDAYLGARRELDRLEESEANRLRTLDILGFQIEEIERVVLDLGEDEALARERRVLANAENLTRLSTEAYAALFEDETAVVPLLGQIDRAIGRLVEVDSTFEPYREQLQTAKYTLEDLAYFLRDYARTIDYSEQRLAELDSRILEIDRLKRKYDAATAADVLAALDRFRAEQADLITSEERSARLSATISEKKDEFLKVARELSKRRKRAARGLEERVTAELAELAMGDTIFRIQIDPVSEDEDRVGTASGIDRVEFLVATNPGDPPRALARIASGGEISRLMLALKTVSSPPEIPRTLVFDEVDVGIGGRVSEAIGQRLSGLSRSNQVLCVTHQAQIARFADTHFVARKQILGDRAVTTVGRLDRGGRIDELARMIGGTDETARRHARELLRSRP